MNGTPAGDATRLSLLHRLQQEPTNERAWGEFVGRYGPKIRAWCQCWHLQEADIQDVSQAVLLRLAVKLREFVYDPSKSFRAWLKTLTRHAWSDLAEARHRAGAGHDPGWDKLLSLPAREDLERRLEEAFDLELLELATHRVRQRVADQTWQAFQLTALDGLPAAEAAAKLGMALGNVFKAKSNVRKLLQEELRELEGGNPA